MKSGETDLAILLASMEPDLDPAEYVFISRPGVLAPADMAGLTVLALVAETEGTTLVLPRDEADARGWGYEYVAARITLRVHSSLAAVGLTAAFAKALGEYGISCNVIAGYFHDHLYVPADRAADAVRALEALRDNAR